MQSTSRSVGLSVDNGLATIRIAREHGNAINSDMVDGLRDACRQIADDPAVRGALLASSGRLFCPGLDLQELIDYDPGEMDDFMARFGSAMLALFTLPRPLVAAVSGHALAGGCLMAVTADRRVLRRGAKVGLNAIRVGVPLPFGVAQILRDAVDPSRIEEVALVGRNYSGDEAVDAGLVHELHDEAGFEQHCLSRLEQFASRDGLAFTTTKRYLRSAVVERIRVRDEKCRSEFLDCWFSEGTRRRLEQMVEELKNRDD